MPGDAVGGVRGPGAGAAVLRAAPAGGTRVVLLQSYQGKARVFPSGGTGPRETPPAVPPADFMASVRDRMRALRKGNSPLKVWE